jgi:succinate-semialdehyde dehydrogenase/glutarate-semialdehyde dehydrogenase
LALVWIRRPKWADGKFTAHRGHAEIDADAIAKGAKLCLGGGVSARGVFLRADSSHRRAVGWVLMIEEPFGPIAIVNPFDDIDAAIEEATGCL